MKKFKVQNDKGDCTALEWVGKGWYARLFSPDENKVISVAHLIVIPGSTPDTGLVDYLSSAKWLDKPAEAEQFLDTRRDKLERVFEIKPGYIEVLSGPLYGLTKLKASESEIEQTLIAMRAAIDHDGYNKAQVVVDLSMPGLGELTVKMNLRVSKTSQCNLRDRVMSSLEWHARKPGSIARDWLQRIRELQEDL